MKKIIKKYTPNNFLKYFKKFLLVMNYLQDCRKYLKHAFDFSDKKSKRHLEADLIFYYHKIEKALSLPSPRPGFGKDTVTHILNILETYIREYESDKISKAAFNALIAYQNFNSANGIEDPNFNIKLKKISNMVSDVEYKDGGVKVTSRNEIIESKIDFKSFANSRFSVRNFTKENVDNNLIEEAVQIAQKTPSVCNRQSSRVYIYEDEDIKSEILKFQNGNAGFGKDASKILIVTVDLRDFRGVNERHQSYIDGGMYAMSLIYAFHSLGLGTCPLNLSITNNTENKLKNIAKIRESEVLMMMIAVGNIPENFKVASSPRRTAREVMTFYST